MVKPMIGFGVNGVVRVQFVINLEPFEFRRVIGFLGNAQSEFAGSTMENLTDTNMVNTIALGQERTLLPATIRPLGFDAGCHFVVTSSPSAAPRGLRSPTT